MTLQFFGLLLLVLWQGACRPNNAPASSEVASTPQGRWALGSPQDFPLSPLPPLALQELRRSHQRQRALGWSLAQSVWNESDGPRGHVFPAWMTWYDRADIERMFLRIYERMGRERRLDADAPRDEELDDAEIWLTQQALNLPGWGEERLREWLNAYRDPSTAHSLTGLGRTFYNRAAARHIMRSYAALEKCLYGGGVPASDEVPPEEDFAPCLAGEFPPEAMIVKAVWRRIDMGQKLSVFATDAEALLEQWQLPRPVKPWTASDSVSSDLTEGFRMRNPTEQTYQLVGFHVMAKVPREWVWTTLWWSPQPDGDFGSDRPLALVEESPLRNFKMCTVTGFNELADDLQEVTRQWPQLGKALAAAGQRLGSATWCSNPTIEEGAGNQATNCIGCHQHGGIRESNEQIFQNPDRYPDFGRHRQRKNFPTDYLWSLNKAPENLGASFHKVIDYYRTYDNLSR